MTHAAIRRITFGTLAALVCAGALAAAAVAAKPAKGAHFKGHTSVAAVEGFFAPVSFTVAADGRSLKSFSFGSFGCFGAGGFKPGVNPYTGGSIIHAGTVKVSSSGRFSVSGASSKFTSHGQTTITTVKIAGSFSKAKKVSGSISFSQKVTGSFKGSCGPGTIKFSAAAH